MRPLGSPCCCSFLILLLFLVVASSAASAVISCAYDGRILLYSDAVVNASCESINFTNVRIGLNTVFISRNVTIDVGQMVLLHANSSSSSSTAVTTLSISLESLLIANGTVFLIEGMPFINSSTSIDNSPALPRVDVWINRLTIQCGAFVLRGAFPPLTTILVSNVYSQCKDFSLAPVTTPLTSQLLPKDVVYTKNSFLITDLGLSGNSSLQILSFSQQSSAGVGIYFSGNLSLTNSSSLVVTVDIAPLVWTSLLFYYVSMLLAGNSSFSIVDCKNEVQFLVPRFVEILSKSSLNFTGTTTLGRLTVKGSTVSRSPIILLGQSVWAVTGNNNYGVWMSSVSLTMENSSWIVTGNFLNVTANPGQTTAQSSLVQLNLVLIMRLSSFWQIVDNTINGYDAPAFLLSSSSVAASEGSSLLIRKNTITSANVPFTTLFSAATVALMFEMSSLILVNSSSMTIEFNSLSGVSSNAVTGSICLNYSAVVARLGSFIRVSSNALRGETLLSFTNVTLRDSGSFWEVSLNNVSQLLPWRLLRLSSSNVSVLDSSRWQNTLNYLNRGTSAVLFVAETSSEIVVSNNSVWELSQNTFCCGSAVYLSADSTARILSLSAWLMKANNFSALSTGISIKLDGNLVVSDRSWILWSKNLLSVTGTLCSSVSGKVLLSSGSSFSILDNDCRTNATLGTGYILQNITRVNRTVSLVVISNATLSQRCNKLNGVVANGTVVTGIPSSFVFVQPEACGSCNTSADCFTPFVQSPDAPCSYSNSAPNAVCPCVAGDVDELCLPAPPPPCVDSCGSKSVSSCILDVSCEPTSGGTASVCGAKCIRFTDYWSCVKNCACFWSVANACARIPPAQQMATLMPSTSPPPSTSRVPTLQPSTAQATSTAAGGPTSNVPTSQTSVAASTSIIGSTSVAGSTLQPFVASSSLQPIMIQTADPSTASIMPPATTPTAGVPPSCQQLNPVVPNITSILRSPFSPAQATPTGGAVSLLSFLALAAVNGQNRSGNASDCSVNVSFAMTETVNGSFVINGSIALSGALVTIGRISEIRSSMNRSTEVAVCLDFSEAAASIARSGKSLLQVQLPRGVSVEFHRESNCSAQIAVPMLLNFSCFIIPATAFTAKMDQAKKAIQSSVVGASVVTSVTGNMVNALANTAVMSLVSLEVCIFSDVDPLDATISPTGFSIGAEAGQYFRGAVAAGLLSYMLSIAVLYLVLRVAKDCMGYGGVFERCRFPSILIVVVIPFHQGMVTCSVSLLRLTARTISDEVLAAVGLLVAVVINVALCCFSTTSFFQCKCVRRAENKSEDEEECTSTFHSPSTERPLQYESRIPGLARLLTLFSWEMHWVDTGASPGFKRCYFLLLDDLRLPQWTAFELLSSTVQGAILGIRDSTVKVCEVQLVVLTVLGLLILVATIFFLPCGSFQGNAFLISAKLGAFLLALCETLDMALNSDALHPIADFVLFLTASVAMVQTCLLVVVVAVMALRRMARLKKATRTLPHSSLQAPLLDGGEEEEEDEMVILPPFEDDEEIPASSFVNDESDKGHLVMGENGEATSAPLVELHETTTSTNPFNVRAEFQPEILRDVNP